MSIYIIRPRVNIVAKANLSMIDRKLTSDRRQQQAKEVEAIYREDSQYQELSRWAKEQNEEVEIIKSPEQPGVTGTAIVAMSPEQAEQTQRDLPEFLVLEDQSIDLIQPHKVTASYKSGAELEDEDLWHLGKISISGGYTGKGITIAVLDTGIDSSHPALRDKVIQAVEFDINQYQAKILPNSLDTDGHGTHVAGLICGDRIGVAPNVKLINGLMIPNNRGRLANFILALDWVAQNPEISLVNVSAGLQGFFPDMATIVEHMLTVGVLPICAVGNEGVNSTRSPGNYSSVVSVGATDQHDRVASFSSSGTITYQNHIYTVPHLVAPGQQVYSSVMQGGYEAWDGTSMATPIVTGIAALLLECYPNITVLQLKDELFNRCRRLSGCLTDRQ